MQLLAHYGHYTKQNNSLSTIQADHSKNVLEISVASIYNLCTSEDACSPVSVQLRQLRRPKPPSLLSLRIFNGKSCIIPPPSSLQSTRRYPVCIPSTPRRSQPPWRASPTMRGNPSRDVSVYGAPVHWLSQDVVPPFCQCIHHHESGTVATDWFPRFRSEQ